MTLKFGQNTLKETNEFSLIIEKQSDLKGLPKDLIAQAKIQAEKENLNNAWLFKATRENLYPFLTFLLFSAIPLILIFFFSELRFLISFFSNILIVKIFTIYG